MTNGSAIRVLIVEDDDGVRGILEAFLADHDFDVCATARGEEALEILSRESYHVAIVDLRLPGLSGEGFIAKASEIAPDLRFLICTGSTEYTISPELRDKGLRPEHLIRKPLADSAALVKTIQALMEAPEDRAV